MAFDISFPTGSIEWAHLQGGPEDDYLIDYKMAVLGSDPETGSLDMLVEFAPNSHCHFHRHIAQTTTLVLRGEQHVFEFDDKGDQEHKVRTAGVYAHSTGPHDHMERGGPEGALVFFSFHEPSGHLFDLLDKDRNVVSAATLEEIAANARA